MLVFSGGGGPAVSAYYGLISGLNAELDGKLPDLCGSSAGAIVIAIIVEYGLDHDSDHIAESISEFTRRAMDALSIRGIIESDNMGLISDESIIPLIREFFPKVSEMSMREVAEVLGIDIQIVATTMDSTGSINPIIFDNKNTPGVSMLHALRCSSSVPGLMEPVDGGAGHTIFDGDCVLDDCVKNGLWGDNYTYIYILPTLVPTDTGVAIIDFLFQIVNYSRRVKLDSPRHVCIPIHACFQISKEYSVECINAGHTFCEATMRCLCSADEPSEDHTLTHQNTT